MPRSTFKPLESEMNQNVKPPLTTEEECNAAALFNPACVVDELGTVKALIAKLEQQEAMLTTALVKTGRATVPGNLFDCTVSKEQTRVTVNRKAIEADLGPLPAEYLTESKPFRTVTLRAKK